MGLLDDAIREHLELKRLRGADPGEVARAEQDALGPVRQEDGPEPDEQEASRADDSPSASGSFFSEPEPEPESVSDVGASTIGHAGQETVEINMEAELERDIDVEAGSDVSNDVRVAPVGHPVYTHTDHQESAEWETSSDDLGERGEIATSESDIESRPTRHSVGGDHIEGAIDEVPDLARDTPEQKRPWFKRRPRHDSGA
jgi:hypothetical protein